MARGVNKVVIIGNLGQDPETRYFPDGAAVTNISVATSEQWKDKQTGQPKEITEWHRIKFFGRLAEIAGEYLKKGSKVYVEGSLRTRKWQDQGGADHYTTEIIAKEMQMLDSRQGGGDDFYGQTGQQAARQSAPRKQAQQRPQAQPQASDGYDDNRRSQPQHSYTAGNPPPSGGGFDDFDDDIPF